MHGETRSLRITFFSTYIPIHPSSFMNDHGIILFIYIMPISHSMHSIIKNCGWDQTSSPPASSAVYACDIQGPLPCSPVRRSLHCRIYSLYFHRSVLKPRDLPGPVCSRGARDWGRERGGRRHLSTEMEYRRRGCGVPRPLRLRPRRQAIESAGGGIRCSARVVPRRNWSGSVVLLRRACRGRVGRLLARCRRRRRYHSCVIGSELVPRFFGRRRRVSRSGLGGCSRASAESEC